MESTQIDESCMDLTSMVQTKQTNRQLNEEKRWYFVFEANKGANLGDRSEKTNRGGEEQQTSRKEHKAPRNNK